MFLKNQEVQAKRWKDDGAVSEHLKKCPYNIKTEHRKPDVMWK